MKTTDKQIEQERKLYIEGDTVHVELLIYPGPKEFCTLGRVVKCLSPTYYEIEFKNHNGLLVTKRFRRSQLP